MCDRLVGGGVFERTVLLWPVFACFLIGMLMMRAGEYWLHRQNLKFLDFAGGLETGADLIRRFYWAEAAAIGLMVLEYLLVGQGRTSPRWHRLVGLAFVFFGTSLRLVARRFLGRVWSLRLFVVPGTEQVKSGPYAIMKHPEYAGRFLEMLGASLFLGMYYSFGAYLALVLILLPPLLRKEVDQLNEHCPLPDQGESP